MTTISLDGRYGAEIKTMRPVDCWYDGTGSTDNGIHVLTVTDKRSGEEIGGFIGDKFGERPQDYGLAFASPKFSPDGQTVYIVARATLCETGTWLDAPRVYRIDLREAVQGTAWQRPAHFVAAGRLIDIVRTGPYAGDLMIQQRGPEGGRNPVFLFDPAGKEILPIPDSERAGEGAIIPWLKTNGWKSYDLLPLKP